MSVTAPFTPLTIPPEAPADLSRAKILAALIAFMVAILLALILLLCLRWVASRIARARTEGGKKTPTPAGSAWGESASRVEVEATGLTGQGGRGPRIIEDPPPRSPDPPAQFDVFEPADDDDEDDGSLDETAEDNSGSPDDTDSFEFDPDDDDDEDDDDDDDWRGA